MLQGCISISLHPDASVSQKRVKISKVKTNSDKKFEF